jgi:hypothetical protein
MNKTLNPNYARKLAKGHKLKVKLRKNKKGTSLFATAPIKKNQIIAYYKFKVYVENDHDPVKDGIYSITVYTKTGRESSKYIGDIYQGSMLKPKANIPFWGYFSNEPTPKQKENAYIDNNLKQNYKNRKRVKDGDTMIYKLRAEHPIKKGEEIVWCYGDAYIRYYPTSC